MAVTDAEKGAKGITSFIVEKDFPGFIVGKVEEKMGLHGSQSVELFFEDCEVPVENVLGEEGQGYVNALKILANGRTGLAARNLGSCIKLLDLSMKYSLERIQFGKPIFEQQIIQHYLADMATDIEALSAMTYKIAKDTDEGKKKSLKKRQWSSFTDQKCTAVSLIWRYKFMAVWVTCVNSQSSVTIVMRALQESTKERLKSRKTLLRLS